MPWQCRVADDPKRVELSYAGEVSGEELVTALQAGAAEARTHGTRLYLADCVAMTGGHSISDLCALIGLFDTCGIGHDMREAILLPALPEAAEDVRFYETACFNRGYEVRLFADRAAALAWLAG